MHMIWSPPPASEDTERKIVIYPLGKAIVYSPLPIVSHWPNTKGYLVKAAAKIRVPRSTLMLMQSKYEAVSHSGIWRLFLDNMG